MTRQLLVVATVAILASAATPAQAGSRIEAQSRLRNAWPVAGTYWAEDETFQGFDSAYASALEPALQWVDAAEPAAEEVDIERVRPQRVLFITRAPSGRFFSLCVRNPRYDSTDSVTASFRYGVGDTFHRVDEPEECRLLTW